MMRHLEGVKLTVKPFFTVFSAEDIRIIPHVKLYVIVVDLESRGVSINCQEKDLVLMAVKHINSIGGKIKSNTSIIGANICKPSHFES